jgi:predicted metal-dependent HD superfamily phosphohydrolase
MESVRHSAVEPFAKIIIEARARNRKAQSCKHVSAVCEDVAVMKNNSMEPSAVKLVLKKLSF